MSACVKALRSLNNDSPQLSMTIMGLIDFLKKTTDLLPQRGFTSIAKFEIKFPKRSFVYGSWPK